MVKRSLFLTIILAFFMLPVTSGTSHYTGSFFISEAHATERASTLLQHDQDTRKLAVSETVSQFFSFVTSGLSAVLFFDVAGFPFLVLWLMLGGVFFMLWLGFVNFRMFGHGISVLTGKYDTPEAPGETTHRKTFFATLSGTIGVGNISGVAVAVSIGGPGAVIWMVIAGILGMSIKFAEVTLGHKYRKIDEQGIVTGGAFYYLSEGLAKRNLPLFGKFLAVIFAIACIGGALGGGNMFQSNQTITILTHSFPGLQNMDWMLALLLAVSVGFVLVGGFIRIAAIAQIIVPVMVIIYIGACITIIAVNIHQLPEAFATIINSAFHMDALGGGMMGAIISGFRRASFSHESGLGSAPIAHATSKTREPVREGCVSLLDPFVDTVIICFLSGLVITITGVYTDTSLEGGVLMTSAAFATVADWFPDVFLSTSIILFAFGAMITWSYYGERAWYFLFGKKIPITLYHIIFCMMTFLGGIINFGIVLDFSDLLILSMAIPNLIGLVLMSGEVRKDLQEYTKKLKASVFARSI